MLEKVGLLPAFNNQQIPFAYEMYASTDLVNHGWEESSRFKHKFGNEVEVEFMGLWCVPLFFEVFSYSPLSSYNYLNFFSLGKR